MKKYSAWITIAYLLINMINVHPVIAAIDNREEILVLHSYSPDYEWTRTEQLGIESLFQPLINQYRMRVEYMDSGHSPKLLEGQLLQQLYKEKFANSHFRVIIVSDNAAFDFLRQYRDELFPGVPVVFCGINGYEESIIKGRDGFTGVAEDNDFMGLFNVISSLHPDLQRIVIYGLASDPSHIANIALIKKILINSPPLPYEIQIREFTHLDACIENAKTLPLGSTILMVGSVHTAKGEGINPQRANEIMSEAVEVPVYTAWDFGISHGAIGGLVINGVNQGRLAAEMALDILDGKLPKDIPVRRCVGNVYMFDYNQLMRFDININNLPPESIIVNAPHTNYEVHRGIIWMGIFFLGCLIITVFILIINIRQRKKAEAALLISKEKFSKAFKHCADIIGIVALDDGRYIEVSKMFYDIFGFTHEEIIGKRSIGVNQKLINNKSFPLWHDIEQQNKLFPILKADGLVKDLETYWCTKSGEIRIGLYSAEIVEINSELCIIYAWHDITDRKIAEDALQQEHDNLETKIEQRTHELSSSNQQLTQAIADLQTMQAYLVESAKMAALGNLVAGIAHEINTPVGVGLTAASHLQELTIEFNHLCKHGTPRRQDLVDYLKTLHESSTIILKNLERAGKLIQSFKKVSADQSSEIRRVFKVKNYLEEIILSIQPQFKKANHNITLECDDTLTMDGFPGALSQIVTNLIMNSVIHAYLPGEHGNIIISAKIADKNMVLLYTDDGRGMNFNVLSKIFDPFYTTKRGYGGTGLGLHVVYNIVTQQFKGTIDCESKPGQGTAFRICLPLLKEDLSNGYTR